MAITLLVIYLVVTMYLIVGNVRMVYRCTKAVPNSRNVGWFNILFWQIVPQAFAWPISFVAWFFDEEK